MINLRVGTGYDIHRLERGRELVLGGVNLSEQLGAQQILGLLGHSDADVLLHSIIDALLGAAGLCDIGTHFPDTDPAYQNADSFQLLVETRKLLNSHGYTIVNLDSTIIAQRPKLAPFIPLMVERIATALQITAQQVNVKAKTNEGLGEVGEEKAMIAQAVVLLDGK